MPRLQITIRQLRRGNPAASSLQSPAGGAVPDIFLSTSNSNLYALLLITFSPLPAARLSVFIVKSTLQPQLNVSLLREAEHHHRHSPSSLNDFHLGLLYLFFFVFTFPLRFIHFLAIRFIDLVWILFRVYSHQHSNS